MDSVGAWTGGRRSEEHTSELHSQSNLVCRLLLEKKKIAQDARSLLGLAPKITHRSEAVAPTHRPPASVSAMILCFLSASDTGHGPLPTTRLPMHDHGIEIRTV